MVSSKFLLTSWTMRIDCNCYRQRGKRVLIVRFAGAEAANVMQERHDLVVAQRSAKGRHPRRKTRRCGAILDNQEDGRVRHHRHPAAVRKAMEMNRQLRSRGAVALTRTAVAACALALVEALRCEGMRRASINVGGAGGGGQGKQWKRRDQDADTPLPTCFSPTGSEAQSICRFLSHATRSSSCLRSRTPENAGIVRRPRITIS